MAYGGFKGTSINQTLFTHAHSGMCLGFGKVSFRSHKLPCFFKVSRIPRGDFHWPDWLTRDLDFGVPVITFLHLDFIGKEITFFNGNLC